MERDVVCRGQINSMALEKSFEIFNALLEVENVTEIIFISEVPG